MSCSISKFSSSGLCTLLHQEVWLICRDSFFGVAQKSHKANRQPDRKADSLLTASLDLASIDDLDPSLGAFHTGVATKSRCAALRRVKLQQGSCSGTQQWWPLTLWLAAEGGFKQIYDREIPCELRRAALSDGAAARVGDLEAIRVRVFLLGGSGRPQQIKVTPKSLRTRRCSTCVARLGSQLATPPAHLK